MHNHTIHRAHHHYGWNNGFAPSIRITPGESVEFETVDSSGGQLTRDSVAAAFPRFTTPGPVTRHIDAQGYDVTTGIGPDLMTGARAAVSGMIDLLSRRHGMAPVEVYMLASVAGDLRISEIVDQPNWAVSFYFPRQVFE